MYICFMKAIIEHIEYGLKNGGAPYLTAVDAEGDNIKIRVSDHCCNDRNNTGRCLSFITKYTERKSGQHENNHEWVMTFDEESDRWLDNQYDDIEQILSDYDLVAYYNNGNLIKF